MELLVLAVLLALSAIVCSIRVTKMSRMIFAIVMMISALMMTIGGLDYTYALNETANATTAIFQPLTSGDTISFMVFLVLFIGSLMAMFASLDMPEKKENLTR